MLDLLTDISDASYQSSLDSITGLRDLVLTKVNGVKKAELNTWMEFVLHGMAAYSLLSKFQLEEGNKFSDITSAMFNYGEEDVDDDLKELFK